ncbi:expressed unknown protein [Seminavis robusta]|uniref:Uncharacterized protein n=1 Tax=Seminavis robusta TaxID=568900 RepID=A0A9N8DPP9_9STRA|nr:expressed unknown protein [Seminavis robusta]CAB9504584.1 expressed unknown protein [Seminavis robusta]|eukprot:Sro201_g085170.1 n/a (206) ;mRNA; f:70480-71097
MSPFQESHTDFSVRRFSGFICLKPQVGYDLSKVCSRTAIITVWKKWAMRRMTQNKPHVGITNTEETLMSSFDVKVNGELNSSHKDLSDEEVIEILKYLFCTLAKALKQTQTKFKFYGDTDKFLCQYNISHSKKSLPESQEKLPSHPSNTMLKTEPPSTKKPHTQSSTRKLHLNIQELYAEPAPTPMQQGPKEVDTDDIDPTEVEC